MEIGQILNKIQEISELIHVSTPYLVGGVPRDLLLKRANNFNDIDITTLDATVTPLAYQVAKAFWVVPIIHNDRHVSLHLEGIKIDFSSNFRVAGMKKILQSEGIVAPTSAQEELYSRDFTINTLLLTIDLQDVLPIVSTAVDDLRFRRLKTCLTPELTLGSQTKRIPRIFYLAAKLDLEVDSAIIIWLQKNPQAISECNPRMVAQKMNIAAKFNLSKTTRLLDQTGLWPYLPHIPSLSSAQIQHPSRL